jgi:hypothetical protein
MELADLGPPDAVAARHRVLVLVEEALAHEPRFGWSGEGPCARWDGEDGERYRGRLVAGEGVLWGADHAGASASAPPAALPDRHRDAVAGECFDFCLWWDGEAWIGEARGAERVLAPLLGDEAASEWIDWGHGLPELVLALVNLLDVVANGIPMTPHALAAFAPDPEALGAMMDRARELGLGVI